MDNNYNNYNHNLCGCILAAALKCNALELQIRFPMLARVDWAPSYKLQEELDDRNDGHDHAADDGEQG